ncbi:DUF115 domain-containing protein [Gordonia alkanivorans]|nr:6-hydroxymethylpterin diphosphokinase MptE-like protein [Gordonia alkanivorans]MDH3052487.1 DUF115 domain-containing protein [Gordonia alkanivorans]
METSAKTTKLTARERAREVAVSTIGETRVRRVASTRDLALCKLRNSVTAAGRANANRIRSIRDSAPATRCVIIGNGPSLNDTDLSLLQNEITFGLNRIYLMYDKLGFRTTYHVVVNQLVVQQCAQDFRQIECPLFTTARNRPHLRDGRDPIFLGNRTGPLFSKDLNNGIWEGATVTYVAMQIAFHMGFQEVVLVGVDHNFVSKGPAHSVVESKGADQNHFDPNYFGKGFKWQLPDLDQSEVAYGMAKKAFEADGRKIVDATVGGKLTVFEKVKLEDFLS